MRISDWSSDVCSSDLIVPLGGGEAPVKGQERLRALRRDQMHVIREVAGLGIGGHGTVHHRPIGEDAPRNIEQVEQRRSKMRPFEPIARFQQPPWPLSDMRVSLVMPVIPRSGALAR